MAEDRQPSYLRDSIRGALRWNDSNWSLCLGAGVTIGMLPSWRELSRRSLEMASGRCISDKVFDELVTETGWHFDAWIQAALNVWQSNGRDHNSFARTLESIVYSDLLARAAAEGLECDLVNAFHDANLVKKARRVALLKFISYQYRESSALQLARLLAKLVKLARQPTAILTFSYDTVLETLIRIAELELGARKATFRRVIGPAAHNVQGKIPIFHLHGCLTPMSTTSSASSRSDSRASLVAPEASYTQMAGSVFTWPQTTFLHYAQTSNLAIVGHSLSDPNIRRWLAWSADVRKQAPWKTPEHVWFRTRPPKLEDEDLLMQSVRHLGVYIVWLDSWGDLEAALRNLVGLSADAYDTA